MLQQRWLQLIHQFLKNKFIQKTSSVDWDTTNNVLKIVKGGPYTTIPTYDQNHSIWAMGDVNNGSSVRIWRTGTGCEFRATSWGGSATTSSSLAIYRAQGSIDSPSALTSGTWISRFISFGYDGSAFINTATIANIVDSTVSAGNVPTATAFFTGATGATERMRINSSGNIGIATTTPGARLQINGGVAITSSPTAASDPGAGNLSLSGAITAGNWQANRITNQYLASNYSDVCLCEDFFTNASTTTILTTLGLQAKISGTGASVVNTTGTTSGFQSGAWSFGTGTVVGNYSLIYAVNTACLRTDARNQNLVFRVRTTALPTASEDANLFLGFGNNSTGAEPTDGAYFFFSSASTNYQLVTQINGVRTSVDSGVAANTGFNIFRILLNSAGTQSSFYINDVFIASMSITASRTTGITLTMTKTAGTASIGFIVDRIIYYTY